MELVEGLIHFFELEGWEFHFQKFLEWLFSLKGVLKSQIDAFLKAGYCWQDIEFWNILKFAYRLFRILAEISSC